MASSWGMISSWAEPRYDQISGPWDLIHLPSLRRLLRADATLDYHLWNGTFWWCSSTDQRDLLQKIWNNVCHLDSNTEEVLMVSRMYFINLLYILWKQCNYNRSVWVHQSRTHAGCNTQPLQTMPWCYRGSCLSQWMCCSHHGRQCALQFEWLLYAWMGSEKFAHSLAINDLVILWTIHSQNSTYPNFITKYVINTVITGQEIDGRFVVVNLGNQVGPNW